MRTETRPRMNEELMVVLVDPSDRETGTMEKLEAHRKGVLHRAFSVFLFNPAGQVLLQQRATGKYHSPGLWSNACCSHPAPGQAVAAAARAGLLRELGIATELKPEFTFLYKADVGGGLTEHELDHVLFGEWEGPLHPNADEVMATRWISPKALSEGLAARPSSYTAWLRRCWPEVRARRGMQR